MGSVGTLQNDFKEKFSDASLSRTEDTGRPLLNENLTWPYVSRGL